MSRLPSSVGKEYEMPELDQDIFNFLDNHHDHHHQSTFQENRHQTLNIFPSQPMHAVDPSTQQIAGASFANGSSSTSKSPMNYQSMEVTTLPAAAKRKRSTDHAAQPAGVVGASTQANNDDRRPVVKMEGMSQKATASSSEQDAPKTPDPKTLRRLAQNREAARKSRLRKKAYIQQLETSRIKLSQLEQDLQMARAQGMLGGGPLLNYQGLPTAGGPLSAEATMFDMEHLRWREDHHKLMCQLKAALEEHLPENQLQLLVESALSHHELLLSIKAVMARSDVFHLTTGTWMSPAERCFLWIGGYRPGELIKIVQRHVEPLTEQQIVAICSLQHSVQESEDALSHGLGAIHQSLWESITAELLTSSVDDMAGFMNHMSIAMSKLSPLEAFVRQADSLRLQTLQRLYQVLTIRQSARCFLAIAEYFHRLRSLSSLWVTSRPRQDGA